MSPGDQETVGSRRCFSRQDRPGTQKESVRKKKESVRRRYSRRSWRIGYIYMILPWWQRRLIQRTPKYTSAASWVTNNITRRKCLALARFSTMRVQQWMWPPSSRPPPVHHHLRLLLGQQQRPRYDTCTHNHLRQHKLWPSKRTGLSSNDGFFHIRTYALTVVAVLGMTATIMIRTNKRPSNTISWAIC